MKEKREHPRNPLSVKVRISHPTIGTVVVSTRDLSDGGVFLVTDGSKLPPLGSVVDGQVQGPMENPPVVKMKIVRIESGGIGLAFCN